MHLICTPEQTPELWHYELGPSPNFAWQTLCLSSLCRVNEQPNCAAG